MIDAFTDLELREHTRHQEPGDSATGRLGAGQEPTSTPQVEQ